MERKVWILRAAEEMRNRSPIVEVLGNLPVGSTGSGAVARRVLAERNAIENQDRLEIEAESEEDFREKLSRVPRNFRGIVYWRVRELTREEWNAKVPEMWAYLDRTSPEPDR
jgi:hypothetical protein